MSIFGWRDVLTKEVEEPTFPTDRRDGMDMRELLEFAVKTKKLNLLRRFQEYLSIHGELGIPMMVARLDSEYFHPRNGDEGNAIATCEFRREMFRDGFYLGEERYDAERIHELCYQYHRDNRIAAAAAEELRQQERAAQEVAFREKFGVYLNPKSGKSLTVSVPRKLLEKAGISVYTEKREFRGEITKDEAAALGRDRYIRLDSVYVSVSPENHEAAKSELLAADFIIISENPQYGSLMVRGK